MTQAGSRKRSHPTKVGDVLGDVLRRSGLARGLERAAVLTTWPEVVGERIAAVAKARWFARAPG
jgi:hypothetical protein